jgi:hypothetical protein
LGLAGKASEMNTGHVKHPVRTSNRTMIIMTEVSRVFSVPSR